MAERGAAAGPAAGMPRAAGLLARAVRPVGSPATWLAVIHLLAGIVPGVIVLVSVLICLLVGFGTLWFFLLGLPVLAVIPWLCRQLARTERARFALLLGAHIPAPPADLGAGTGLWRRVWRFAADSATRRQFGYALVRLPVSCAEALVVLTTWSFAVATFGLPLLGWLKYGVVVPVSPVQMAGVIIVGLVVLLAAPRLTHGLAVADTAIARYLIGPGGSADMSARIGELERSRARVVDAAEAERRRIERDLHDGAQQRLVALAMDLGRARARFAEDPDGARTIIDQAHAQAKEALAELRNLVRGVHPPVLTDRGLDAAISGLAALSPVPVTVRADLEPRPPAGVEAIAYFVVAEALTNVAKHSGASRASVVMARHGNVLRVLIRDDGAGGADRHGQGLAGLADRVAGVDGRLSVHSPAGGPTVIEAELPCGS